MNAVEQMLATALRSHNAGRLHDAELGYRKILMRNSRHPGALNGLGVLLHGLGRHEEARSCLERVSRIIPQAPEPYNNLGLVAAAQERGDEALALYRQAVALSPQYRDGLINLATALLRMGKARESMPYFEQLLQLDPGNSVVHNNMAQALLLEKRLEESLEHYRIALNLQPNEPRTLAGMADLLWGMGQTEECIAALRRAIENDPTMVGPHSSLAFYLNYSSSATPREIFEEHVRWGKHHADPLTAKAPPHTNAPDPDRRLRIGYVSADFQRHVASLYSIPVMAAHNRRDVEIFCYANVEHQDFITLRLKNRADAWRDIWGMSDESVAELIRADGIDILVDLNGHTAHHRLLTFARKPAPVQVSWLGYFNTTGMRAMDYRLTDSYLLPPGEADELSIEELVRLPVAYCYSPPAYCPAVGPSPVKRNGWITFGSSNNPGKISDLAVAAWSEVLLRTPGSRLHLNYPSLQHAVTRTRTAARFARHSVEAGRIDMLHTTHEENLASYNNVDISLDTFPFNGATTTLESLWMGVPVISLAGSTFVSRMGPWTLTHTGLTEFVASSPDEYVAAAVALANDRNRLELLRGELRNRLVNSPLTNLAGFTSALETAYRRMWQRWCREQQQEDVQKVEPAMHFSS